jgi:hypothetical protein
MKAETEIVSKGRPAGIQTHDNQTEQIDTLKKFLQFQLKISLLINKKKFAVRCLAAFRQKLQTYELERCLSSNFLDKCSN